jgi:hypothetical protein
MRWQHQLFDQTARIADEVERTREICNQSLEVLRRSVPDTFLGRTAHPVQSPDHSLVPIGGQIE